MSGATYTGGTGTYQGCETNSNTLVKGTYSRDSVGLIKLTQTDCYYCQACNTSLPSTCSSGVTAGSSCSSVAASPYYALESPGMHVIVQPLLSTETPPIYMVEAASACPTQTQNYNFIFSHWSSTNNPLPRRAH